MNTEILELLRENNKSQSWEAIENKLQPLITKYIDGEPVYQFFDTLSDKSLKKNGQLISVSTQPVNSFVPYHLHNYIEMMVVLLGSCVVKTQNEIISLKQDEIIFIGSRTIHKVEEIDTGTIVVNIALRKSAFSLKDLDFLTHSQNTQTASSIMFSLLSSEDSHGAFNLFHTNHDKRVLNTIYDIISEYYKPDNYSNQIIKLEILELFIRLIRIASNNPILQVQKSKQNSGEIGLLTLLLYIEKNYKKITLKEMAAHFGFNPNYLSSFLKKKTGYTFIKLVHLQRINVVAEYLSLTNVSIEEISTEVGYENPSYLYKIFRDYVGCSPTEYRRRYQNQ